MPKIIPDRDEIDAWRSTTIKNKIVIVVLTAIISALIIMLP